MEIWKDIKGYEGLYQVSNYGRVKSLNFNRGKVEKILKQFDVHGYFQVKLYKNKNKKNHTVHRLVAEAFIPNTDNLSQVNHKDEDKHNNFCGTPENDFNDGNLEWCDCKYNQNYGSRTNRSVYGHLKPVLQFTKYGEFVREFPSAIQAERDSKNEYCSSNICNCCRGRQKTHQGYIWKYKE